ncbi:MAG: response regulator [Planctomycetota bacterium]|jgi:DNA-binding response OmpR family regulator
MERDKPIVLYIDDDQDYLDTVRVILEANGFEMAEARSAEEGLTVFRHVSPDAVIVDLMMEEVDSGTSLVRDLMALGSQAPIYMLSSVGDNLSMTTDYTTLGLAGVFQKPIDGETLVAILRARIS